MFSYKFKYIRCYRDDDYHEVVDFQVYHAETLEEAKQKFTKRFLFNQASYFVRVESISQTPLEETVIYSRT